MIRERKSDTPMTFRVSETERDTLLALAEYLERNVSDTIRYLIRDAARSKGLIPPAAQGARSVTRSRDDNALA